MRRVVPIVVASICLLAGAASAEVQSPTTDLIRHDTGLLLWDTGVPDAVAAMPDGLVVANGAITYRRA